MLVEACRDEGFAKELLEADVVTPDGMPLVWLMRRRGALRQERVAGMDLFPALCTEAERQGLAVFFLGSTPDVLDGIRARAQREHPRLEIAGMEAPQVTSQSDAEDAALVARINASGAGFLFIAFGCPKQERWIYRHRGGVQAVMVGLGGAFSVYAKLRGRAPLAMQQSGLEWLYRLVGEPRRLWRRYLVTNTLFLWFLVQERLANRRERVRG